MKKVLLLSLFVLVFTSCATPPHAQNREVFGEKALPIWMPLTFLEHETLLSAKQGMTEELKVKLAILFTSKQYDDESIKMALQKYHAFINSAESTLASLHGEKKAQTLYALFFKKFIVKKTPKGQQSGGVLALLSQGQYDINSAVILFSLFAEHFGFTPKVLITKGDEETIISATTNLSIDVLSGDLYLQLEGGNLSTPIVIVPTWKNGFGITPDLKFFTEFLKNNPDRKQTAEVELERYNKKKVFSLLETLMLEYKIDKAYEIVDLDFAKGIKRTEMAAQLTDSCEVLIDRAWGWRNIYASYAMKWKAGEILPFIELIQSELNRTTKLCSREKRFMKIAGILHLYAAREYALNNRGVELKNEIKQAVTYLDTQDKEYKNNRQILINAVHIYLKKVVESGDLQKDVANINAIIASIPDKKLQLEVAAAFYFHAGQFFFKKSKFVDSADFYNRCVKMGESQFLKVCEKNATISYLNRAALALNNSKCSKAKKANEECKKRYPNSDICKQVEKLVGDNCK